MKIRIEEVECEKDEAEIHEKLREFMNTKHFKKLEISHLRQRVNQLERQLEEEFEEQRG